jgi:alkylation response protein AidB-like acyl-CoA dehydrogenase
LKATSEIFASEMSVKVTEDAKIHTIFEGTSEIQQLVIARAISGLRVE